MRRYVIQRGGELAQEEALEADLGVDDVKIDIRAVSLNRRDLLVIADPTAIGRVPISDGAGEVVAVGRNVRCWRAGDRVAALFFRDWRKGPYKTAYLPSALGGCATDGVLSERVVLPAASITRIPDHLSMEEAATLPSAAVTAWAGLIDRGGLSPHDTILIHGTGGVALFALQLAKAIGARAIVTSYSDEKLVRARELGADHVINCRAIPDWDIAVRVLTNDEGVSHVLEVGGMHTYRRSLSALADSGKIIQLGATSEFHPNPDLLTLQFKNADIVGVTVGSGAHFEALNTFLTKHRLKPVIDRAFEFEAAPAALEHLRSAMNFGKIVIRI